MAEGLPQDLVDLVMARRGRLAVFDEIDPAATALLVVDMQKAWLAEGAPFETPPARAIVPAVNRLAAALRARNGLVVWIQHTNGPDGDPTGWPLYFGHFLSDQLRPRVAAALAEGSPLHALGEGLAVDPADWRLPKHRFSAFLRNSVDLEARLRARGIDTLIVTGTATDMCCESTARDAMMLDFRVFMPHDAVAAMREDRHLGGLRSVAQNFADIRGTEDVLALIGRA